MSVRMRKPRTVLLTISVFTISFVVLLNVMLCQLTMTDISMETHQSKLLETARIGGLGNQFDNYYAIGRRKPKATNLKSPSEGYVYRDHAIKGENRLDMGTGIKTRKAETVEEQHKVPVLPVVSGHRTTSNTKKDPGDFDDNDLYSYSDDDENNLEIVADDDDVDDDDDEMDEDYDQENYGDNDSLPENPVFNMADFSNISNNLFKKPPLRYRELDEIPEPVENLEINGTSENRKNRTRYSEVIVEDGIFWSPEVEKIIPKGLSTAQMKSLVSKIRKKKVQYLHPPTWNKCGRPKNGFAILDDNSFMCARYRDPHNKLVLGEVLSFYLSRMLGMNNVPTVVLSKLNESSPQWKAANIHSLGWEAGKTIALIHWIPDLDLKESHVKMPPLFMEAYERQQPITAEKVREADLNSSQLSELIQWGSMIIFDYLTANYDRVASMQDAADKEQRPSIIKENIRNLRKSSKNGKLWLIDNESGLLDAYDLSYKGGSAGVRFVKYHKQMLQTMCVFQRSLVGAVLGLHSSTAPHVTVEKYARQHEPLIGQVPRDATYSLFQMKFSKRLQDVSEWIQICQEKSRR